MSAILQVIPTLIPAAGGGPSPKAWWKFDDGSGTAPTDSSGNGYTLTNVSTPLWGTGHLSGDLNFNAGSGNYTYITTCPVQTGPFTVAGWINVTAGAVIWSMLSSATSNWDGWYGGYGGGNFTINAVNNNSFGTNALLAGASGSYVHTAFTVDGSGNGQVYVSGSAGSSQAFGVTPSLGSYQFCIAASKRGGALDNVSTMGSDDWRIYDSVLSGADISTLAAM